MASPQTTSNRSRDEIAEKIKAEREQRTRAERDRFDALFAEWLTNRAEYMKPEVDWSTRDEHGHGERETELARLITTTPAVYPWMIFSKLEVLEHYLGTSGGTAWSDNREVVMLAGIKADLLRFEPSDGGGVIMATPNPERDVHGVIFDMEDDVRSARDLIRALMVMAEHGCGAGLDREECEAMNRVAGRALTASEDVKEAWERAFELTKRA